MLPHRPNYQLQPIQFCQDGSPRIACQRWSSQNKLLGKEAPDVLALPNLAILEGNEVDTLGCFVVCRMPKW